MMKRYITIAIVALAAQVGVMAQQETLSSRSLTIEGSYNPTMNQANKIMPTPDKTRTVRTPSSVNYLTESQGYDNLERQPIEVFGQESDKIVQSRYDGLIRLGYGLRNLHDGLLDLGWNITERDYLKLSGSMYGWNSKPDGEWRSLMHQDRLALQYSHSFKRVILGFDSDLGYARFNYRPGALMDETIKENSNLYQNSLDGSVLGSIRSRNSDGLSFYLSGGAEWFKRYGIDINGTERSNRETLVRINAGLTKELSLGALSVDYKQKTALMDWVGLNGTPYKNFAELTVTPKWHFVGNKIQTDLGANVDIRTAAGKGFLMSPQIDFSYFHNSAITLMAGLTGGVVENDMRSLAEVSPYWSEREYIKDGYDVVNSSLGIKYNQGSWLVTELKAGYKHTIDEVFQTAHDSLVVTSLLEQESSDMLYVRLNADMQFSDRNMLRFDISYNKYLGSYEGNRLALKPYLDATLFSKVKVMNGLDAMLSYRMMLFPEIDGVTMPMVNDLSLTADYDINKRFSCYMTLSHLFGGDFYYYAGYRTIKPAFLLGAVYRLK